MTTKSIGRLIFLKYFAISTVTIVVLTTFILRLAMPTGEPLTNLFTRIFDGLIENSLFLLVQVVTALIGVWVVGGQLTIQIQNKKNFFLTSGLAFIVLWFILFLSSTLTASTLDAIEMDKLYFRVTFERWTNYHLVPFIEIGIVYGLCLGFFMGKEIKNQMDC